MSRVVKYEACPQCRRNGRDNRGDNLVRYSDGGAHCFSCGHHEWGDVVWARPKEKINGPKGLLPFDFTRDVPTSALKWLLQYGLPYSYWQDSIGFSPSEERLVFLVGTPTQFSIGRYVGTGKLPKWKCWGDSHKHCEIVRPRDCETIGTGERVCLVEDLVSAHKIAMSGASIAAVPLFGVQIHPCHLYYLMQEQKPIVLWLDKDQQGTIMKKANWLQALTGQPVSCVVTDNDPKSLSFEQIRKEVNA